MQDIGGGGYDVVPEKWARREPTSHQRPGSYTPKSRQLLLRPAKRLSRKYSLALLALLLLGISLADVVTQTWDVGFTLSGSRHGSQFEVIDGSGKPRATRRLNGDEETSLDPPDTISLKARRQGAVVLHCIGLFYMFIAIALVCDECFVPALEVITEVLDLSPDVAGATFMAAGGSAPEFFTSLIGSVLAVNDIGIGTIIGSAVFNVLFVIGACALVAPEPLHLTWFPLARDSVWYSVDLVVVTIVFLDGWVMWYEAVILFSLYCGYTTFMTFSCRIEKWANGKELTEPVEDEDDKKEDNDAESWATTRRHKSIISQQSEEHSVAMSSSSRASAGTGDAESVPASATSSCASGSFARSSTDERHGSRNHFRHKSLRMANHITILTSGEDDVGNKQGAQSPTRRSVDSTGSSERRVCSTDSTGGSADPVPHNLDPGKVQPEWELTDVVPAGEPYPSQISSPSKDSDGQPSEDLCSDEEEANEPLSIVPPGADGSITDWMLYILTLPILFCLVFTIPDVRREGNRRLFVLTFFMSIVWIFVFTWVMLWFAQSIAETCGVEEHIMGLTILAAGTSVPDLLTSMIVARQGHGDMAISSSIGSNIFDVTVGLPIPWFVACLYWGRSVRIQNESLEITVLLLMGMLAFTIGTIVWHSWVMTKWMGSTLLFLYLLFEVVAVGLTFAPEGELKIIHV